MSDGTEPAEEQPHPSTAKGRSAHSGGASERLDQRMLSRWAPPAAVLIAVVALAVAVWALLRPRPPTAPHRHLRNRSPMPRGVHASPTSRCAPRWRCKPTSNPALILSRRSRRLEAMAIGLPVVITESSGLADTVRASGCGIVVDHSQKSLTGAVRRLIEDPALREEMGDAGRKTARENFSMDAIGRTLLKVYGLNKE
jgi:hypothetical protein